MYNLKINRIVSIVKVAWKRNIEIIFFYFKGKKLFKGKHYI